MRGQVEVLRGPLLDALARDGLPDRERAIAYGELGRVYLAAELYDAAIGCLERASALEPEAYAWTYLLAHAHHVVGDDERAIQLLRRAATLDPEAPAPRVRLGDLLLASNALDEAAAAYGSALEVHPGSASAHHGLARIALLRGEPAEAVEQLEAALRIRPEASGLREPLARALRMLGNDERAEAELARRGDVLPRPFDPLLEAVDALLADPAERIVEGVRARAEGRLEDAAAAFRGVLRLQPGDVVARQNLGEVLHALGDRDGARAAFEAIVGSEPEHAGALTNLGNLAAEEGHVDEALRLYASAVRAQPDLWEARLNLGSGLLRLGRADEALPHLSAGAALAPDVEGMRLGHAMALALTERYAEARREAERALSVLPGSAALEHVLARLLAAAPDDALRDGPRAMRIATRLVRVIPHVDAVETLAMAQAETGDFRAAVATQRRAIDGALRAGRPGQAERMRDNLLLYEAGRPCRRPWRPVSP